MHLVSICVSLKTHAMCSCQLRSFKDFDTIMLHAWQKSKCLKEIDGSVHDFNAVCNYNILIFWRMSLKTVSHLVTKHFFINWYSKRLMYILTEFQIVWAVSLPKTEAYCRIFLTLKFNNPKNNNTINKQSFKIQSGLNFKHSTYLISNQFDLNPTDPQTHNNVSSTH